jgi:hypothetical protein
MLSHEFFSRGVTRLVDPLSTQDFFNRGQDYFYIQSK